MNNLTPYFTLLAELRDALADNLVKMGVTAAKSETLQSLVLKVLLIPQGDLSQEVFLAEAESTIPASYGFFGAGETASFAGICTITALCRVTALRVTLSGTGAESLTVVSPGWTQQTAGGTVILQYAAPASRFAAQAALDALSFSGDGETQATVSIQVSAETESGQTLYASGATAVRFFYGATWETLEDTYASWSALEVDSLTWSGLETMPKPEVTE